MDNIRIAIDGPAGAGKSTVAKIVAEKLGLVYIDTGAMYRAIAYGVISVGIKPEDEEKVACFAREHEVSFSRQEGILRVLLDGNDVSTEIRTPEIGAVASTVSAFLEVRSILGEQQRKLGAKGNVVMDGRDIGTNVMPDAELKVFLTADVKERAMRRFLELKDKGSDVHYQNILSEIAQRDEKDMQREHSPLKKADDAVNIDTTGLTISEVAAKIIELAGSLA